jgi:hypothetical protein
VVAANVLLAPCFVSSENEKKRHLFRPFNKTAERTQPLEKINSDWS